MARAQRAQVVAFLHQFAHLVDRGGRVEILRAVGQVTGPVGARFRRLLAERPTHHARGHETSRGFQEFALVHRPLSMKARTRRGKRLRSGVSILPPRETCHHGNPQPRPPRYAIALARSCRLRSPTSCDDRSAAGRASPEPAEVLPAWPSSFRTMVSGSFSSHPARTRVPVPQPPKPWPSSADKGTPAALPPAGLCLSRLRAPLPSDFHRPG